MKAYAIKIKSGKYVCNICDLPFLMKTKKDAIHEARIWGKGAKIVQFELKTVKEYKNDFTHPWETI